MSRKYTYKDNEDIFIEVDSKWSRKSIKKATSGVSVDMAETINTKLINYCLIRDNGTYITKGDDFDVEDIDILVLRWIFSSVVDHIDFLLK